MVGLGALAFKILSRYLVQILAGLAIVSLYFAWEHHVQALQKEKDVAALAKRDAGEKVQSEKLMNEAITRVTQARQEDQDNTERVLKEYAKIISERSRPITVIGMRDKSAGKKSDNCTATGQADISEGSLGTVGRTGQEVPELAKLCLLAADEIRRTHVIK